MVPHDATPPFALGLDAGGTATRIAIVDRHGAAVFRADAPPLTGHLWLGDDVAHLTRALADLHAAVAPAGVSPGAICLGLTGIGEDRAAAARVAADLGRLFGVPDDRISVLNDVALAYGAVFQAGEGVLVYAGTGSIAVHVDAQGRLHRVGGRGVILDDAGGAYWIATRALRQVWRAIEDEAPGAGESPLATALFGRIGGRDWDATRRAIYGGDRGTIGMLAIAVGVAADQGDPAAGAILQAAGRELARLGLILARRHGLTRIAVAGGALRISPRLFAAVRAAIPTEVTVTRATPDSALGAARRALQGLAGNTGIAAP
jgi:N-acetylglucosamine kinase-like BadF-type ATPase